MATMDDIACELHARSRVRVCAATVRKALRATGIPKDHDRPLSVATAWIWLAEARILATRLTQPA